MDQNNFEKFLAKTFTELPRKPLGMGQKQQIWLTIQNHLRQVRQTREAVKAESGFWAWFRYGQLTSIALAVVLAVGVVSGATKVSEGSLPGDTLYPVKKVAERVEKVFAQTQEAKIKVVVKHAKRRLEEVKTLVAENKGSEAVTGALQALQTSTELVVSTASAAKPELIEHAVQLVNEETAVLRSVKEQTTGEELKKVIQRVIVSSNESITKLRGETSAASKVEGAIASPEPNQATSTPSAVLTPSKGSKPKPKDSVIESPVLIHDIIRLTPAESLSNPTNSGQPAILQEPSL